MSICIAHYRAMPLLCPETMILALNHVKTIFIASFCPDYWLFPVWNCANSALCPVQSTFISGNNPIDHREYTKIYIKLKRERERERDTYRSIQLQLINVCSTAWNHTHSICIYTIHCTMSLSRVQIWRCLQSTSASNFCKCSCFNFYSFIIVFVVIFCRYRE